MGNSNGLAYAMVVALDSAMIVALDSAMMRVGTRAQREQRQRDSVLERRMRAEGHNRDLMVMPYGGAPVSEDGKLRRATHTATIQKSRIRYTTKGDFTHLHSGRNELR